jgi:hypothetical protein
MSFLKVEKLRTISPVQLERNKKVNSEFSQV